MDMLNFCVEIFLSKLEYSNFKLNKAPQVPYFPKILVFSRYHVMYCIADGILRLQRICDSFFFKTLLYIMNFQLDDEDVLLEIISNRHDGSDYLSFKMVWEIILILFFPGRKPKQKERELKNFDFIFKEGSSSDFLCVISNQHQDLTEMFINFMYCTCRAILWSMLVFCVLRKVRDKNKHSSLRRDFNFLISACSILEEGDIAVDILALSDRIAKNIHPLIFAKMPVEDAKIWLEYTKIDEMVLFSDFLNKHGHRCYKEVDIFQKCWSMDPMFLVRALQVIVPFSPHDFGPTSFSLDHIFNQLPVMPSYFQKLLLKYTVPKCVKALKEAKKAKSDFLKITSVWRKAFYNIAGKAVKEFRIPFPEALFFLSLEEIRQLLDVESPHLVTKALKCWEIHSNVDKYKFPTISVDYPVSLGKKNKARRLKVGHCLKGCPVSKGTAVGKAVVIKNFSNFEAASIEKGCILITHRPSIVWSLYFSVIGGFAADVGGLLSDGAIAARECGLPCVIGLSKASKVLKTGDRVFLDGSVGILRRMSADK